MRKSIIMKAVLCVCVLLLCGCVGVTHTSIQTDKTIDDDKDKNTHKDNKKVPKRENPARPEKEIPSYELH